LGLHDAKDSEKGPLFRTAGAVVLPPALHIHEFSIELYTPSSWTPLMERGVGRRRDMA
jgi:hypothetical protein